MMFFVGLLQSSFFRRLLKEDLKSVVSKSFFCVTLRQDEINLVYRGLAQTEAVPQVANLQTLYGKSCHLTIGTIKNAKLP